MQKMMIYWQSIIPQHVSGVFMPIIRRADCVHCLWFHVLAMVVAVSESSAQCTHLATRLSGTTTTIARTWHHGQWHAVCSPDDGRKDTRNMLRNYWLPINHHLLHLAGLAFICLSMMHGHSSIKLRAKFAHSIQLIHPDEQKGWITNADASGRAIGSILL
jgi:hypothetical protein